MLMRSVFSTIKYFSESLQSRASNEKHNIDLGLCKLKTLNVVLQIFLQNISQHDLPAFLWFVFSFKKKDRKLPFSYNPRGYCLFLYQVNCMWPQSLQQRLYMRPKMKILQSPSIFRCKYHLPSKSPREMRKKDNKHFSNYYSFWGRVRHVFNNTSHGVSFSIFSVF